MGQPVEYKAVIRLLYLNGSTPKEALDEMKVVYREDVLSYDVVKHWHGQFKCRRTSVETVPIPGHPLSAIDDAPVDGGRHFGGSSCNRPPTST